MSEKQLKQQLINDYEKYVESHNRSNAFPSPLSNTEYLSVVSYISDLFFDLFGEDIENYIDLEVIE